MSDLFNNPVTVIAIVLSIFFTLMALAKRWSYHRSSAEKTPDEKPYQIADPYTPPSSLASTHEPPTTTDVIQGTATKVFRQFGSRTETEADETSEYVWE